MQAVTEDWEAAAEAREIKEAEIMDMPCLTYLRRWRRMNNMDMANRIFRLSLFAGIGSRQRRERTAPVTVAYCPYCFKGRTEKEIDRGTGRNRCKACGGFVDVREPVAS